VRVRERVGVRVRVRVGGRAAPPEVAVALAIRRGAQQPG